MFISSALGVHSEGRLTIGGADVASLAREYGTPLYIMDEGYIRAACRTWTGAMRRHLGDNFMVVYASKALCASFIYRILDEEGLGADVVSGGELFTARNAGFPADRVYFHGNNKSKDEIEYGLDCGVRRFVVDNVEELHLLNGLCAKRGTVSRIAFRVKPGIEAHTHEYIRTGQIDSKFGVALETGEAMEIVREACSLDNVVPVGVGCHIGSQIFEIEPFENAVDILMAFMARVRDECGVELSELNLGGGYGIRYMAEHDPPELSAIAECVGNAVRTGTERYGLKAPFLVMEPGRSIVGPAGITVYTIGAVKMIPGMRTYVSVDGGMNDNIRHALYGANYEALLPERPLAPKKGVVTIAGRLCESADIVAHDVELPEVRGGDLLAVLATGAYNYSMASNYNRLPRPPIVLVNGGKARVVVRRETYEDLIRYDT